MPFENKIGDCPVTCGLIFHLLEEEVPVPLKSVDINARIVDFVANVTVQQRSDLVVLDVFCEMMAEIFVFNSFQAHS